MLETPSWTWRWFTWSQMSIYVSVFCNHKIVKPNFPKLVWEVPSPVRSSTKAKKGPRVKVWLRTAACCLPTENHSAHHIVKTLRNLTAKKARLCLHTFDLGTPFFSTTSIIIWPNWCSKDNTWKKETSMSVVSLSPFKWSSRTKIQVTFPVESPTI